MRYLAAAREALASLPSEEAQESEVSEEGRSERRLPTLSSHDSSDRAAESGDGDLCWVGTTAGPWWLRTRVGPPIDAFRDLDIAAAIVDRLNARFLAGEHDLADGVARILDVAIAELSRRGVEAWLATADTNEVRDEGPNEPA